MSRFCGTRCRLRDKYSAYYDKPIGDPHGDCDESWLSDSVEFKYSTNMNPVIQALIFLCIGFGIGVLWNA